MENTVNVRVIRALLPLAADVKMDRPHLECVRVEFHPDKTIYVATNGRILGVYTEKTTNEHPFTVSIPRDVVKQIKPAKANYADYFYATLKLDKEANTDRPARLVYPASGQDLGFTPLAYEYPDYMRVIPKETSGKAGQFDAEYIYAFSQVNKALGASQPGLVKIDHNGPTGGALVHLSADDRFVGVLMPCRM